VTEESLENDLELADSCWSSTNKPSLLIQASNELKVCMYRILRTRVWNVQSLSCEEDNSDMHAAGNRNRQNGIQINENCISYSVLGIFKSCCILLNVIVAVSGNSGSFKGKVSVFKDILICLHVWANQRLQTGGAPALLSAAVGQTLPTCITSPHC
jgi:hypothetical protein